MDCSPLDSSVHEILQERILKWIAFLFSRGSSQPRDQTQVYRIGGRYLFSWVFGRKATTNLDSTLKSRDVTLLTKVHTVNAMVFPVVMYGCVSWTIKKAKHRRIDAFELWCWRILLRVPWTARRSNQSILKKINPEYSWEGLMLKRQYFGYLR